MLPWFYMHKGLYLHLFLQVSNEFIGALGEKNESVSSDERFKALGDP